MEIGEWTNGKKLEDLSMGQREGTWGLENGPMGKLEDQSMGQ